MEIKSIFNECERILRETLLFKAIEVLRAKLGMIGDVIVADFVELWKHKCATDRCSKFSTRSVPYRKKKRGSNHDFSRAAIPSQLEDMGDK